MYNLDIKNITLVPKNRPRQHLLLAVFGAIMLAIRIIPQYHIVFTTWLGDYGNYVNFSADDAVYHMRLVHNTLHHFPWRVFFDPFTHFPYGNQIHFGPLFTLIIATVSLVIGLGHPTPELVNIVGAYIPPILGALCLIPVYSIARNLAGEMAAIIGVFVLAFLPGEFLQRSSLGFTDHHVAEVLFSTATAALLICALNAAKNTKFEFKYLTAKDNHPFLLYSSLTGIAFSLFILTWPAALLFGAIFLIFFVTQLIIDHSQNNNPEYLLLLASNIYGIPTILVLPYALMYPHLDLTYYSLTQPLILLAMATIFGLCYIIHLACKHHPLTKKLYFIILLTILFLIFLNICRFAPKLYLMLHDGCKLLLEPTIKMRTVSEVRSSIVSLSGDKLSIARLWGYYFWTTLFTLTGFIHLYRRVHKHMQPAEIFLLIWTTIIILSALTQCRFNYYLAINVAILTSCYSFCPLLNLLDNLKPQRKIYAKLQKTAMYIISCIFIILIIDPILLLLIEKNFPSGLHISHERYKTLMWLKKHTPDPQEKTSSKKFDYHAGYYPIPQYPNFPYNYPKNAYGIMSWWDNGHQITYVAERIPNANPFQLGINEKNNAGAASFFISSNEEEAVKNLNFVGSRYILIDHYMANKIGTMSIWRDDDPHSWTTTINSKTIFAKKKLKLSNFKLEVDSAKFLQSMMSRLFYDDANGLQHFRLIHESDGDYLAMIRRAILKPNFYTDKLVLSFTNHNAALASVNAANDIVVNKNKTIVAYGARPPTKKIKVFEKVKGAIIIGNVAKNIKNKNTVTLSLKLKTKFDRIFTYHQTTKVHNGQYKFIVPYPTSIMRGSDYNYDIKPIGNYKIHIGNKTIEVVVPEDAVMQGKTVKIMEI